MCNNLDAYCILYEHFSLLQGIKGKIIHTPHPLVTVILASFTMGIALL